MSLELLISLIKNAGLEEHQQTILATVKPAIAIDLAEKGQGNIGQSRIGGYPDLPASLPWPIHSHPDYRRPLCFILQLNFSELPNFPESPLPKKGMLYLFQSEGENDAEQLIIYRGDEPLQPTYLPEDTVFITDWYGDLVVHTLNFSVFADLPRWATADYENLTQQIGIEITGEDALSDLVRQLPFDTDSYDRTNNLGKLLGHASGIGHDPREDAFIVREVNPEWLHNYDERGKLDMTKARSWQHFLGVKTENNVNLMFGDAGYLQILIHEHDLKKQDFSKVYVDLESS
jgi:Domain of unknown function (DUF1963)